MYFKFITLSILLSFVGQSLALDCSSVIVKESEGVLSWLGNVTFVVPVDTSAPDGWLMTITFDQVFTGLGVWDVWTRNHGDEKYAELWNRDHNADLKRGDKFSFRFRINYFTNVPQPKATSLRFFDTELCN